MTWHVTLLKCTIRTPSSLCLSLPPRLTNTPLVPEPTPWHTKHVCNVNQVWFVRAACLCCQSAVFECQMSVMSVRRWANVSVCVCVCMPRLCNLCAFLTPLAQRVSVATESSVLRHWDPFSCDLTASLSPVACAEMTLFVSVSVQLATDFVQINS